MGHEECIEPMAGFTIGGGDIVFSPMEGIVIFIGLFVALAIGALIVTEVRKWWNRPRS